MAFDIGSRVGDYEILAVLGAGGMGQVYKVRNLISDRVEAMKILLPNLESEPELADRFLREIKVQASLVHPNIAQLHTAVRVENQLLMLMEFVEGLTLEQKVRQGALGIRAAIDYMSQTLAALSFAHARGVIHRDIKPANMMLTPGGTVKLMDFGIAKAATDRRLTMTGTTMGSLYYMSPEQIQGATDLDARADLYSAGISLYELVTGKRPFDGDSQFAIMSAHLEKQPVPPISLDATLPPALNDIILMSVAKDPAQRFQTADAFRNALQSVAGGAEVTPATRTVPAPARAVSAGRRSVYVASGALAMALAVVGIVQFGPWRSTSANPTPPPAQTEQISQQPPQTAPQQIAEEPPPPGPVQAERGAPAAKPKAAPPVVAQRTVEPPPVEQDARPPVVSEAPPQAVSQPPAPDPAALKELQDVREALAKLEARASAVRGTAARLQSAQAASGLGLRGDAVAALNQMNSFMQGATEAVKAGDAAAAKNLMRSAERQVELLEKIFNL
jgi:serine/threonine-protein kinase